MNLASFILYCVIVTFTPGPTNIVILSMTNHAGVQGAWKYVLGASIAFGILLAASAVMNAVLIRALPAVMPVLRIGGGVYILYLAVRMLRTDKPEQMEGQKDLSAFLNGFLMQFVNPKVILFTLTVIPSFVLPFYHTPFALTIFVSGITMIGFLAFVTWMLFGTVFRGFLQKNQKIVNIIMAVFLGYSAIMVSGIFELSRG